MTPYNFVSETAYISIMGSVENRIEFDHDITVGKVHINFSSGFAGCDFGDGKVMEGDYIILENFGKRYGDGRGFGWASSVEEFIAVAKDYTEFIKRLDKFIKDLGVEKYEPLEAVVESGGIKVSQLALFI